jgi:hypothetical protein
VDFISYSGRVNNMICVSCLSGAALNRLAANTKSLLRMDASNGILQLAWEGIPNVSETQVDAKRHLDQILKTACISLKQNAHKLLLGPLDAFLAKVAAFCGEIPIQARGYGDESSNPSSTILPPDVANNLKSQAFVKPDRIRKDLESAQETSSQKVPELRDTMKV